MCTPNIGLILLTPGNLKVSIFKEYFFLWRSRERASNIKRAIVLVAKRILTFRSLAKIQAKNSWCRLRGAQIGLLVINNSKIDSKNLKRLEIGQETALGRCEITLHDLVKIGKYVVINDGAILLTASHALNDPLWPHLSAPIVIGDYAWIATNAIVLPGTTIGRGAVVGAGAVVRGDIPDYAIVAGNPATVHTRTRTTTLNYSPVMMNAAFEAWVGHSE